jgi:phospholipase/lecithinase/hemolysin
LPEEMPTNETIELCSALRTELTLPIAELVVNAHLAPMFADTERAHLAALGTLDAASAARQVLMSGARRALRERIQDECLQRLAAIGAPLRTLAFLPDGAATPEAIARLAQGFSGD